MGFDGCCVYLTTTVESFTLELTTRFPTSHFMDVMGICYPQYLVIKRCGGEFQPTFKVD
jgi:hypothetical protein